MLELTVSSLYPAYPVTFADRDPGAPKRGKDR